MHMSARRTAASHVANASTRGRAARALVLGAALLAAVDAQAHAPPLAARVLSMRDGAEVIVTNRGLVFREPSTGAAELLCNEALRINTAELPHVAVTADGALLVATSSGLRQTRDRGCSWSDVGQMQTSNTPALAQDPRDPDTSFVARYDGDAPGVLVTRDGGASWSLAHPTDAGDYVRSLLIAPADSQYVYATLTTFAPGARPVHALLRSRDGGAAWERLPLPLLDTDNGALLATGDPADPEALLLYTVANSPGLDDARLLRSDDAGSSFELVLTRSELRAASIDAGGRTWVAARDGLYGAGPEMLVFEQVSAATELGCVQERDGALLVCGHYAGAATTESGIGVFDVQRERFEPVLDFSSVATRVTCAPDSLTEALCQGPWRDWQAELLAVAAGTNPYTPAAGGAPSGWSGAPAPSRPSSALDAGLMPPLSSEPAEDDPATVAGCASVALPRTRGAAAPGWIVFCGLALVARLRRR
jgi:hypothetical protein